MLFAFLCNLQLPLKVFRVRSLFTIQKFDRFNKIYAIGELIEYMFNPYGSPQFRIRKS